MQPTRITRSKTNLEYYSALSLFGLAPNGVYPAISVTKNAVSSYPTISPLPLIEGGIFSVALSLKIGRAGRYPALSFHGARTFLTLKRSFP